MCDWRPPWLTSALVIYQDPLAYLLGLEGVALLDAWAGDHDRAFTEAGSYLLTGHVLRPARQRVCHWVSVDCDLAGRSQSPGGPAHQPWCVSCGSMYPGRRHPAGNAVEPPRFWCGSGGPGLVTSRLKSALGRWLGLPGAVLRPAGHRAAAIRSRPSSGHADLGDDLDARRARAKRSCGSASAGTSPSPTRGCSARSSGAVMTHDRRPQDVSR